MLRGPRARGPADQHHRYPQETPDASTLFENVSSRPGEHSRERARIGGARPRGPPVPGVAACTAGGYSGPVETRRLKDPLRSLGALARTPASQPLLLALLTLLAWHNRFIQDDAFISFRYASHLAQGLGLVWNPEERIEGYTNFLWTVVMALPHRFGWDPVPFSQALGLGLFAGTLAITWRLVHRVLGAEGPALLTVVLLGTNYTFSAYATGGLETQLQALLVTAAFLLALMIRETESPSPTRLGALSLVCSAALLTRLDSAIPVAFALAPVLRHVARLATRHRVCALSLLFGPLVLVTGSWLVWKLTYYGDLLPNTFYLKAPAVGVLRRGLRFDYEFALGYALVPIAVIALVKIRSLSAGVARPLLGFVLTWALYVTAVGGDFMEFRLMVPAMPVGWILAVRVISSVRLSGAALGLAVLMAVGSLVHAATFRGAPGIESIGDLGQQVEDWAQVGKVLAERFGDDDVMIAVTAAGAIPYYSRLRTVDMLGLSDRWVALHGAPLGHGTPGHRRVATHRYLHRRGVNLVVGHPQVEPPEPPLRDRYAVADLSEFMLVAIEPDLLPASARVVEIPMGARKRLHVIYLEPNARVEEVIRTHHLRTREISRE